MSARNESPLFNMARDDLVQEYGTDVEILDISVNTAKTLVKADNGKTFIVRSSAKTGVTCTITLAAVAVGGGARFVKMPPYGGGNNASDANTAGAISLAIKPPAGVKLDNNADAAALTNGYAQKKGQLAVVSDGAAYAVTEKIGTWG